MQLQLTIGADCWLSHLPHGLSPSIGQTLPLYIAGSGQCSKRAKAEALCKAFELQALKLT